MKKAIAVLMCVLMLIPTGCQKREKPTATVITPDWQEVELPLITIVADEYCWVEGNLKSAVKSVPGYDTEFTAEFVKLEREPERSMYLERMRVELMAGKGPDLFLCDCLYGSVFGGAADEGEGPMFNFPEQLMKNRIFLPLDGYLKDAKYMEPDKFIPEILELGRGKDGQMIIPLQYDFNVTAMPEEKYEEPAEKSRRGLLDSGNPCLEYAGMNGGFGDSILDCFGEPADYEKEELAFTEEELLEVALDFWEWEKLWDEGYFKENAPDVSRGWASNMLRAPEGETEGKRLVPTYNRDGGVTAYVANFAAINRNANYPEYAFRVLDWLAGRKQMREPFLYSWSAGIAPYDDFGDTENFGYFTLTDNMKEQYLELKKNITAVKFITAIERESVYGIVRKCQEEGCTREDVEKAVRDSYRAMKMMLAES